jgi:hypothetical protein
LPPNRETVFSIALVHRSDSDYFTVVNPSLTTSIHLTTPYFDNEQVDAMFKTVEASFSEPVRRSSSSLCASASARGGPAKPLGSCSVLEHWEEGQAYVREFGAWPDCAGKGLARFNRLHNRRGFGMVRIEY